ncbi:MAG: rod shape-determining protein MreC [Tannerella sp.]|jgi:rod shape-determining protein MreC|nr:rod shape-determining protein MreC [Tannerella sp.]
MRKLLEFLVAKRHWLLFLFCEIIAFTLIYRNNAYQRNMMMTSANVVTGRILSVSEGVFSYLDLRKINQQLLEKNNQLEMQLIMLHRQLDDKVADTLNFSNIFLHEITPADTLVATGGIGQVKMIQNPDYECITAVVVNNSTIYTRNYITINKGSNHGIHPDMGVISTNGLAGIVKTVKPNYSVIISVLNTHFNISAKVKSTNNFGTLSWKGGDSRFAYLEELPTHSVFKVGDTIVTSGYSTIFPSGILIGTVDSFSRQHDDNFFSLKVRLETDFQRLRMVGILENKHQEEQEEAEREATKND